MKVRVRIAPSPTGDPHVGTAYIALFNYIFAKQHKGDFIIRIEDTDRARFDAKSEEGILKYLQWLGLNWDEGPNKGNFGPYKQSLREYKKYADRLVDSGRAYKCYCTEERLNALREEQKSKKLPTGYDGKCRDLKESKDEPYVIRLKAPRRGKTIVHDMLRGAIEFDNTKVDDQILLKMDGMPTYHLANVVDDHLMEITHVIRAEEWVPSTPKHVMLYEAFEWAQPIWVHMPLLRNSDRSKISKRKNAVSLEHYYNEGFLKEALLNFLALMGWHPKDEIFSIDYMIENFDFKDINLGGPVFDVNKLRWINREYMRSSDNKTLASLMGLYEDEFKLKIIEDGKNEFHTLKELKEYIKVMSASPVENFVRDETIISKFIESKELIYDFLNMIDRSFNEESAKEFIKEAKEKLNFKPGKFFPALRASALGLTQGIEIAKLLVIYSKEDLIKRVKSFEEYLNA